MKSPETLWPPATIESPVPATVTVLLPNVTPSWPEMEMPLKLDAIVPAANPLTPAGVTDSMPEALLIEIALPSAKFRFAMVSSSPLLSSVKVKSVVSA